MTLLVSGDIKYVVYRSQEYFALDSRWHTWEITEYRDYSIAKMVWSV